MKAKDLKQITRDESINSITKGWARRLVIYTAPLFFIFAFLGEPEKGLAAQVCAGAIIIAARFLWDLRTRAWYWITLIVIVICHVPFVLFPWPKPELTVVAAFPAALLDFGIVYGLLCLGERVFEGRSDQAASGRLNAGEESGDNSSSGANGG